MANMDETIHRLSLGIDCCIFCGGDVMEEVKCKCPMCGKRWIDMQNPEDEWFRLATDRLLCPECGKKEIERIKKEWTERDKE